MSYYLIGIGGTGARCVEAFVNISGAGLLKNNEPVHILIVDPDRGHGNLKDAKNLFKAYNEVCGLNFGSCGLFANKIDYMGDWSPVHNESRAENKTLNQVFSSENMDEGLEILFHALFTEQERNEDLKVGFKGHPAIGAAILSSTLDLKNEKPWCDLRSHLHEGDKIFLFASVFGGTGAAGFPTIAKILKSNTTVKCKIGGALMLPYFDLPTEYGQDAMEMHAKTENFLLNTKGALKYYDEERYLSEVFDSVYLIGDSSMTVTNTKFKNGGEDQDNQAHIVELYAALAAFDFINKEQYSDEDKPYIIGRQEADNVAIGWDDLAAFDICLRDRLKYYIKYLYVYQKRMYPELLKNKTTFDQRTWYGSRKSDPWFHKMFEAPAQGETIDLRDEEVLRSYTNVFEYSIMFFKWLRDIHLTNSQSHPLMIVNSDVIKTDEDSIKNVSDGFDYNTVILDMNQNDNELNNVRLHNLLNEYKDPNKEKPDQGSAIFLSALYSVIK